MGRLAFLRWSLLLSSVLTVIASPAVFRFDQKPKLDQETTCGYQACDLGDPDKLNVHLVAHTHDDVGWLKTVDQYFYGAHNEIQHAGVQYILDTVIQSLEANPRRRFIYVEVAFFWRWWNEQDDFVRHLVKDMVNKGRLEFILGGWCMNDEASTHYNAIIDQHTLGFKFLRQNFGECGTPRIGWQIDPFGHSREQASLFAQFGFDGLFFGRLDYQDKNARLKQKTMEHMWMGSQNLGEQSSLFTGVNFNGYSPPGGFCFDVGCTDAPFMDDARLEDYNVEERINDFLKAVNDQAKHYTTNHIMITMGSDFQFENAHENFKQIDKLIHYVNQYSETLQLKVNVLYSTPSCYLYALNQANQTYTAKSDDFFPYASDPHVFWTGYFTSRPALKGYVRSTNNFLQVCKQLDTLSQLESTYGSNIKLDVLREAMGVAQHHDAVSGTEKQAVAYDYAMRLARGIKECQDVVNYAYAKLMPKPGISAGPTQEFCTLLNVSHCPATESNSQFTVTAYNPLGRPSKWSVRLPVTGRAYQVHDQDLQAVSAQLVPLTEATGKIPEHKGSKATATLVFNVQMPPLGFATYFITQTQDENVETKQQSKVSAMDASDMSIKNEYLRLDFSAATGRLKGVTNLVKGISIPVQQELLYYKSYQGNDSEPQFHSSGAYVFRPNGTDAIPIATGPVQIKVVKGQLVEEVQQTFSTWASQVIRLYAGHNSVEIEWTVGPIPAHDEIGKEVISRFTTDLKTQPGTFYTDANGREILKRVRDYRPTWPLNQTEPVAGNYYPVNSRIYIKDESRDIQLTLLTDRSQGGASIRDGQMEVMVHRRLFNDDNMGVGEALNETGISGDGLVVRGFHYLVLESIGDSSQVHRDLAERLYMAPSFSFAKLDTTAEQYKNMYKTQWSGLKRALSDNVHLLTLEQWEGTSFLLRLEHFYEKGEDPQLSKPATVSLKDLFTPFSVESVEELTLGANQKLIDAKRLSWNVQGHGRTNGDMSSFVTPVNPQTLEVVLQPMQIRTFKVNLQA